MKVLVTFAVDAEFAPWRKLREFRRAPLDAAPVYEARVGVAELRVLLTGIGPAHARRALRAALEARPDLCVSSGLAGGLRPEHRAGDILAARAVCMAGGEDVIPCEESAWRSAVGCKAKPVERFYTSERLARTPREKAELSLAADAVEMESYAVLAEARAAGVPGVAIRAVSDAADADLPYDFDRAVDARGRIHRLALLAQVARRPHRLASLLRLGRQSRRAAASLAQFLDVYVECVAAEMSQHEADSLVAAT